MPDNIPDMIERKTVPDTYISAWLVPAIHLHDIITVTLARVVRWILWSMVAPPCIAREGCGD